MAVTIPKNAVTIPAIVPHCISYTQSRCVWLRRRLPTSYPLPLSAVWFCRWCQTEAQFHTTYGCSLPTRLQHVPGCLRWRSLCALVLAYQQDRCTSTPRRQEQSCTPRKLQETV